MSAKYKGVFGPGLRKLKQFEVRLYVHSETITKFHKARPVPYSLGPAVEAELNLLEKEGVVSRVSHSAWGASVVIVPTKDSGISLCGESKVTVNQVLDVDKCHLSRVKGAYGFHGEP